jgi:DNA polymerase (family X)
MPIHNSDIARIFNQMADLLEIKGGNQFRVRAYRNAACTVGDQPQSMVKMLADGEDLSELPGVGKDLAGKIAEIVRTGTLKMLKDLEKKVPGGLSELLQVAQLGPKRVAVLHKKLDIESLDDLAEAARQKKIRDLNGFGEKTEEKILQKLKRREEAEVRTKLFEAEQVAEPLEDYLKKIKGIKQVTVAGSYRRRRETVGDLDILVTCKNDSPVMESFIEYEDVVEVIAKGKTKSTVRLRDGLQVDLRVVPEVSYGAALHYFTGSKEHNVAVRKIAVKKG